MSKQAIAISKLPDAGLGNKLFTWAHGAIFANKNNIKHYSIGWVKLKLGPILRREGSMRIYKNYFAKETIINKYSFAFQKRNRKLISIAYQNCGTKEHDLENKLFLFSEIPHWKDYFEVVRENRDFLVPYFFQSLSKTILEKYHQKESPCIGVHIRMGDFKKLQATEDFAKVGAVRTPMQYFISIIQEIRAIAGSELPVTIFSDGNAKELSEILNLTSTKLAEDDLDILQMLHLSKSKLIILSAGSTFGQWAGYLSDAVIINHYQHFHSYIRPESINQIKYEGVINPEEGIKNNLLIENIKQLAAS